MLEHFAEGSKKTLEGFEQFLKEKVLLKPRRDNATWEKIREAAQYSLFSGGKRFRPLLSLLTAEALKIDDKKVYPYAAAIEMIHTYSLIHDDLPCLDNDDFRRGQETNHKKFGEPLALLAGDALLTEAFTVLGRFYKSEPSVGMELVEILGEAAGPRGMVGGQVMDISDDPEFKLEHIDLIHELKTGALIRAAVEGVAVLAKVDPDKRVEMRRFGEFLGYSFQLADDILDYDPLHPEATNYASIHGLESTKALLTHTSDQALECLNILDLRSTMLEELVEFNLKRDK